MRTFVLNEGFSLLFYKNFESLFLKEKKVRTSKTILENIFYSKRREEKTNQLVGLSTKLYINRQI